MTDTKWSVAPWAVGSSDLRKGDCRVNVKGNDGYHVAKVSSRADEQVVANAHLIASAPDLYEALDELLKIRSGRTVKAAKSALAKARGETLNQEKGA